MIQQETSASTSARTGGPVRTCVGCRGRELAVDLLRVVATDVADDNSGNGTASPAHVVVDIHCKLPGRGAWLHPRTECFHLAVRRRAFARALRITGNPDTNAVLEHLTMLEDRS